MAGEKYTSIFPSLFIHIYIYVYIHPSKGKLKPLESIQPKRERERESVAKRGSSEAPLDLNQNNYTIPISFPRSSESADRSDDSMRMGLPAKERKKVARVRRGTARPSARRRAEACNARVTIIDAKGRHRGEGEGGKKQKRGSREAQRKNNTIHSPPLTSLPREGRASLHLPPRGTSRPA